MNCMVYAYIYHFLSLSLSFSFSFLPSYPLPFLFLSHATTHISNNRIGNGSWVIAGVTTTDVTTSANLTSVQCVSTHLTSFAVLVDVAGGLQVLTKLTFLFEIMYVIQDLGDAERTALQIVSYIGCAISIICLSATVIFFLFQGYCWLVHRTEYASYSFILNIQEKVEDTLFCSPESSLYSSTSLCSICSWCRDSSWKHSELLSLSLSVCLSVSLSLSLSFCLSLSQTHSEYNTIIIILPL